MPSIADCLKRAPELTESDSSRLDLECLLVAAIGKPRSYLYTWPERELTGDQLEYLNDLIKRRLQGEPIAHLVGEKEFWGLSLEVNASTLIPRPETELLVELALSKIDERDATVADLGTGTGAIAFALASERPCWTIYAVDCVVEAVELAQRNRTALGFENVKIERSDWFEALQAQRFNGIVSNPPYIADDDSHLRTGDLRFEPASALSSGRDGLDAIRNIIASAHEHLFPNGWLLLEHGYEQAARVRELLTDRGFVDVETASDLAGNDRVTFGRKP